MSERLQQCEINSVNVDEHVVNWRIDDNYGDPVTTLELKLSRNVLDDVTLAEGQLVEVWFGFTTATDKKWFTGYIEKYEPDLATIKVSANGKFYKAANTLLPALIYDPTNALDPTFPDGKYSDAFLDIVTTYVGLNADATTVQDTGTLRTITRLICTLKYASERLAAIAAAMQWIIRFDADDEYTYFEPKQFTANANTLTVGDNVQNVPRWKYDKTFLINDLRVDGAYQASQETKLFSGNGSNQTFTLDYVPLGDVALYYSAAVNFSTAAHTESQKKVLGVTDSTSTSYDFTVDKANKVISTVGANGGGFTPAAGTNNVLVIYTAKKPVPIRRIDSPSITTYQRSPLRLILTDVITVADARSRVANILNTFKDPFKSTELHATWVSGVEYKSGESVPVVDANNAPNVNETLTIWGVTYQWPDGYDIISVGNKPATSAEMMLNIFAGIDALNSETIDDTAILSEDRTGTAAVTTFPVDLTVTQNLKNDTFWLDDSVNGAMYDPANCFTIDNFNDSTGFSAGTGSVSLTITTDSTANHFWIGGAGVKAAWVATSGTGVLEKTISATDFSTAFAPSAGVPTRGTAGIWAYTASPASVSSMSIRFYSSATDYKEYAAQQYAWKVGSVGSAFALDNGRTYLLFDADNPSGTGGTLNWSAVTKVQLRWVIAAAGDLTFNYNTASRSNVIAGNGLGDRRTALSTVTYTY